MPQDTQESRTERITVAVTPSEEHAAKTVVMVDKVEGGVSGLLRVMSLAAVLARYDEIIAAVPPASDRATA